MNVLLTGTSDSIFIRDYCLYVLDKQDINTVVLTPSLTKRYGQDYEKNSIKEIKWPDFFLKGIRKQLSTIWMTVKEWHELEKKIGFENNLDVLHIHYVEPLQLIYLFPIWKKARKRVLTFWGSDLFSASKTKLLLLPYFLKDSTAIVFMIKGQCEYFQTVYGHKYDSHIHIIDFGNSILNRIDQVQKSYSREECKQHFNLPIEKFIVHIGYNAARAQQHMEMLEGIVRLPGNVREKMKLVFHISYGLGSDFEDYQKELVAILQDAGLDYAFFDTYLQGEELAMFRNTCDIFVYGQKTDARSASPLEYIYAGARFVCPRWLANHYELLDEAEIKYYVYDNFDELPEIIQICMEMTDSPCGLIGDKGRNRIRDEISWDSLAPQWRNLYE